MEGGEMEGREGEREGEGGREGARKKGKEIRR